MPRPPRVDPPGSWHHVMNRGLAHRPIFEGESDMRFFLARLALAVRGSDIEVHAYVLLTNHYHLYVRSPAGRLSEAIQHLQAEYVRRFNRRLGRDGPLFRGRFRSKRVTSFGYQLAVVRYMDRNAQAAGLARDPCDYPFGSAYHHARGTGPRWLERSWIDSRLDLKGVGPEERISRYREVFAGTRSAAQARLVRARIRSTVDEGDDALDQLLAESVPGVREWMRQRAFLADRVKPGMPIVDARTILTCVAGARGAQQSWPALVDGGRARKGLDLVRPGLLRDLGGLTTKEIAVWLKLSHTTVRTLYLQHARLMDGSPEYAERVGSLGHACLHACHGDE